MLLPLADITNYKNIGDWLYIVPAAIIIDLLVIFYIKYPGSSTGVKSINEWYTRFGIAAVAADVISILIGIAAARYIYTGLGLTEPFMFIVVLLLFQLAHDLFFGGAVINPVPKGHNQMIDVFKSYISEIGGKVLAVDAAMMLGSAAIASFLKFLPDHYAVANILLASYAMCYVIYTRDPSNEK
jgi:hypothetical protein